MQLRTFPATRLSLRICAICLLTSCSESICGVYQDERAHLTIEFVDEYRVLITSLDVTVQGSYSVDGEAIVINGPQGVIRLSHDPGHSPEFLTTSDGLPLFKISSNPEERR